MSVPQLNRPNGIILVIMAAVRMRIAFQERGYILPVLSGTLSRADSRIPDLILIPDGVFSLFLRYRKNEVHYARSAFTVYEGDAVIYARAIEKFKRDTAAYADTYIPQVG